MKHFNSKLLLTLLLLMCATITFAYDFAVSNSDGKTIYYNYNSDGSSVSVYRSSSNKYTGTVVIPKTVTYNGRTYSVTSIDYEAFSGCSGLTSVTIPNSVTSIGGKAFFNCSGLTSVTIPNSVTSIGEKAFFNCSGLTSVIIGNSVTRIGYYTFYDCSGLTSVTIPNSVTSISSSAFSGCSGLTSVTIPNSVTSIGSEAFYNTSIKSLTIGTDIQTMESNALRGIDKVIWLSNTPPSGYKNAGGTINYVPNDSYSGLSNTKIYPFLSSVFEVDGIKYVPVSPSERTCDAIDCVYNESAESTRIGNTVTYKNINMTVQSVGNSICTGNTYIKNLEYSFDGSISSSAFSGCNGLTSVTIGSSVTSIGSSAFSDCSGLTSVSIPNSVTSIGSSAFSGCSGLTSVTIPNSVTRIGYYTFYDCSGLTSVTIGNSVTSISSNAFYGCSRLTSITWNAKNYPAISSYSSSPFYYIRTQITEFIIGDDVTSIPAYMCYGMSNLESVTIPNSVTSIGSYAFQGCSGLTSVTIPNSVTSIGSDAFKYCHGLTSVTIPNSVTTIGSDAFSGCN